MTDQLRDSSKSVLVELSAKWRREAFHRHVDYCKQCSLQPHDLCPTGARLLIATMGGQS